MAETQWLHGTGCSPPTVAGAVPELHRIPFSPRLCQQPRHRRWNGGKPGALSCQLSSGLMPPISRGLTRPGVGFGSGFIGGLITGVREPDAGGGSTNSWSPVGGGLKTLGSSVGVGGRGFPGFSSGTGVRAGGAPGSLRDGVDAAQAPTAKATTAADMIVRMAHLSLAIAPLRVSIRADDG